MKKLLTPSLLLSSLVMVGCSEISDNGPKSSSDFSTGAIDAFYYFEIEDDNDVGFRVRFEHDDRALELDGGDRVEVVGGADTHSFTPVVSGSSVTYIANVEEGSTLPSNYQFKFLRDTQQDSDNSFVSVPVAFDISAPSSEDSINAVNGRYFDIVWDANGNDNANLEMTFDFNCSRLDGTSSVSGSKTLENVTDNGSYRVDLLEVLETSGVQTCNDFDITLLRIRTGALDLANLNGGSIRGAQIRQVLNLTIEGISLN